MPAEAGAPWPLVTKDEREQNWKPGGFQVLSVDPGRGLLYVLMHQGGEWSHKQSGREVWVFDLASHRRVRRIALKAPAAAIRATADARPLLFAVCPSENQANPAGGSIGIYSALDGAPLGSLDGFLLFWPQLYGF
jgi:methylamine dehydrogenase heavy chain